MSILERFNSEKSTSAYAGPGVTVNGSPEPWPGSFKTKDRAVDLFETLNANC